jgi:HEAT repeat protein
MRRIHLFAAIALLLLLWGCGKSEKDVLIEGLRSDDEANRHAAARLLGKQGAEAAPRLIYIAADVCEEPRTRVLALDTLEGMGMEAFEPLMVSLTDGTVPQSQLPVFFDLFTSMEAKSPAEATKALVGELGNTDKTRADMAMSYFKFRGAEAIPGLLAALKSKDEAQRKSACEALKQITGKDFPAEFVPWLAWWEMNKEKFKSSKK